MSVVHNIAQNFGLGSSLISGPVVITADQGQAVSASIPASTLNKQLDIAWAQAKLQSLYILASQNCTLYINAPSTGSPTDTIALIAGIPYVWLAQSGVKYPITGTSGAVTSAYVTTPATPTTPCDFELRAAIDL